MQGIHRASVQAHTERGLDLDEETNKNELKRNLGQMFDVNDINITPVQQRGYGHGRGRGGAGRGGRAHGVHTSGGRGRGAGVEHGHGHGRELDADKSPNTGTNPVENKTADGVEVKYDASKVEYLLNKLASVEKIMESALVEIKVLNDQVRTVSRENLVLKQEVETLRDKMNVVSARVKRVETKEDIRSYSTVVASADSHGAPATQASRRQSVAPTVYQEKNVYLLFTGMREAEDWTASEEHFIKQYLQTTGCDKGIVRVERLGRRMHNHKGMGRFVLAQYLESDAQRVMQSKAALESKGVSVRCADRGFRHPPKVQGHGPTRVADITVQGLWRSRGGHH